MAHSEFIQKLKAQLEEWDFELDRMEHRASDIRQDLQDKYQAKYEELKAKREEVTSKLKKYETATEEAAGDIKQALESAWDSIKLGFMTAKSEFKDVE